MLPSEHAGLCDDVKEFLVRTNDLKRSLGHLTAAFAENNFRRVGRPSASRDPPNAAKQPRKVTYSPVQTPDKSASPLSKHAGKTTLNTRLQQLNHRLVLTKAGKPAALDDSQPAFDRAFRLVSTPTCTSRPTETSVSMKTSESPRRLPHVSLISGKVKQPLQLPTYKEYCEQHKVDFVKGPTNERTIRHAKEAIDRLEKLKKHLNGLSILLETSPGTPWNKKLLYRLDKYPTQRASIIKAYSGKIDTENKVEMKAKLVEEDRRRGTALTPQPVRKGIDAYRLIKKRADDFSASQLHQNQKLIDILDRYELERPFLVQKKAQFIAGDHESFKDTGHAMRRFHEYRRGTEDARCQRVERARQQIGLYEKMLEFLKTQQTQPSEAQLLCLDIVKNLLEEGWAVDGEIVQKIREALGEEPPPELENLLHILEE